MGNSIEEDMKYIHKTLNDMKIKDEDAFMSAVATTFRDYKRVLKENEELNQLLKSNEKIDYKRESEVLTLQLHLLREEYNTLKQDYEMLKYDIQDKRFIYIDTPEFEENFIPVQKNKRHNRKN